MLGKEIILKSGEVGTVIKDYGLVVMVELRNKPMILRPNGMFHQKRVVSKHN